MGQGRLKFTMTVYLDCNATTPIEPRVRELVLRYMTEEYGNAGSRTHEFGTRASQAVSRARAQVAAVVSAGPEEVTFTSGATESNNLLLLGLAEYGRAQGRTHIISTQVEHKAVLEPLGYLREQGFEVTLVPPTRGGWVAPEDVAKVLRPDTLLVSVMQVNNETGVVQPLGDIADLLSTHSAVLHTDAAQGFGKVLGPLRNPRVDAISISGHKVFAPKGIGALVVRRRGGKSLPLRALSFGGGQERGLRPGTLPVPLVVGLGLASEIAVEEQKVRQEQCSAFRSRLLEALAPFSPTLHGDQASTLPHVVNLSIRGIDSEALMLGLRGVVAISNGSACTSSSYSSSHVLSSMGLEATDIDSAVRISWCHLTKEPEWTLVAARIRALF